MRHLILFTLTFSILCSCRQNSNPETTFLEVPTSPKKYSNNLLNALDSTKAQNYVFNFRGYKQIEDREYINIQISGNGLDAEIPVLVRQWSKLEEVKKRKGIGFNGAEFQELHLKPVNDEIARFEYKNVVKIVD